MRATTVPTSISSGAITTCPNQSADKSKRAPISIVIGNTRAWSTPTNRLAIWGQISPTKPILPPIATQKAANITADIRYINRFFCKDTPNPMAVSSFKFSIFNVSARLYKNNPSPHTMGSSTNTCPQLLPKILPNSHVLT